MTWYAWGIVLFTAFGAWATFDGIGKQRQPITLKIACAVAVISALKIVGVVALALRCG